MRLRTYESFFLIKNGLLSTYPSLQENKSTEIVVLGGGITGALISHALLNAGYETVLLDKRDIGMGSTSATTSMLQYELDIPLFKLAQQIGEEAAVASYKACQESIYALEQLIKSGDIDCGFVRKSSLQVAHNKKAAAWLHKEFEIRDQYQLGVQWLHAEEIQKQYGLRCAGGILSVLAASMDAYQFTHALISNNAKIGLQVYDQVEIKKIAHDNKGIQIHIKNGALVRAKKLVYCTGYETMEFLKDPVAKLYTTFVSISEEQVDVKNILRNTLIWDTEDPYLYLRTTDDNRLLVGGADVSYQPADLINSTKEKKSKVLMKKLSGILPGVHFIDDFTWAGVFGSTKDGLPYIGSHPDFLHSFFVLGFGGNGIMFSVQGMKMVLDWMKGKENMLASLYRFGR